MRKRISIVLITIAIIIFAAFSYYTISQESYKKTDSIMTDKNGKVVEPISGDNDNIGHWCTLIQSIKALLTECFFMSSIGRRSYLERTMWKRKWKDILIAVFFNSFEDFMWPKSI